MADTSGYPPQDPAAQAYPPPDPNAAAYPPPDPNAAAYPPQQQGYPPQQQQPYPPQQGYDPQQGYPPQQQGYPPQQQGYDTKGAYPPQQGYDPNAYPQKGAPPPYTAGAPVPQHQQQTETNVVVVQTQPQVYIQPVRRTGDHGLIYATAATVCILFFGTWLSWTCTIPAIYVSISAKDSERRGDTVTMQKQARTSVILTSTGIAFSVIAWIVYIIFIFV